MKSFLTILFLLCCVFPLSANEPEKKNVAVMFEKQMTISNNKKVNFQIIRYALQGGMGVFYQARSIEQGRIIWTRDLYKSSGFYVVSDNTILIFDYLGSATSEKSLFQGTIYSYKTSTFISVKKACSSKEYKSYLYEYEDALLLNYERNKLIATDILNAINIDEMAVSDKSIEKAIEKYCKTKRSPGWKSDFCIKNQTIIHEWASARLVSTKDPRGLIFLLKNTNSLWLVVMWGNEPIVSKKQINNWGIKEETINKLGFQILK